MPGPATQLALQLDDVHKRFGAIVALDGAGLAVRNGTVHAVLGENGAGKTTLLRVAYGMVTVDSGTLRIGGRPLRPRSPSDAIAAGIGMVHQHFALVDAMRVTENVALGRRGWFHENVVAAQTLAVAKASGLAIEPAARVGELDVSARQRVEIVKALARDARILILDEPTAVLPPSEAVELLRWVREFAQGDRSAILVTHKLQDALAIADDITVLRAGRTVMTTGAAGVSADALAGAILGDTRVQPERRRGESAVTAGSVVAEARALDLAGERGVMRIRGASFAIRAGEIVAVAGVEGSGQRELMRALAGRLVPASGDLALPSSIGYVPDDRQRDGLILEMSLAENVALREAARRSGWGDWSGNSTRTAALIAEYDVRAPGPQAKAGSLSGGNQQKLILARELNPLPALLVAEHPARGLDVRAAAAVQERLLEAARSGAAVVLASHDLDELVSLADRVLVVHAGVVTETPVALRDIGRAMVGA